MIYYDIEIARAIPPKDHERRLPGIEYCDGWHDFLGMGIACLVAMDSQTGEIRVFGQETLHIFVSKLAETVDTVVGFNNYRFDDRLLETVTGYRIQPTRSIDLLRNIWIGMGLDPDQFSPDTHAGYGLDAMYRAAFPQRPAKRGRGELAPIWWQQGKYPQVIDYCIKDVTMLKELCDEARQMGCLPDPTRPGHSIPVSLRSVA